jgi:hypothetical protein
MSVRLQNEKALIEEQRPECLRVAVRRCFRRIADTGVRPLEELVVVRRDDPGERKLHNDFVRLGNIAGRASEPLGQDVIVSATQLLFAMVRDFEQLACLEQSVQLDRIGIIGQLGRQLTDDFLQQPGPCWQLGPRRESGAAEEHAAPFAQIADK